MADSQVRQTIQSYFIRSSSEESGIFSDLDYLRLMELDRMQQTSIYPSGVIVFTEGDQPQGIYFICSGRVKLWNCSTDGRAVAVGIAADGDIIGVQALLSEKPHNLIAETLERSCLCFIKKSDFLDFLSRNGDVSLKLARKLSGDLYEAHQVALDLALKRPCERLAELLLKLCRSHGELTSEGIALRINLSQEEMAEMVGTSRRNLTRALMKLKSLELIKCCRRFIIVRDKAGLENQFSAGKFVSVLLIASSCINDLLTNFTDIISVIMF